MNYDPNPIFGDDSDEGEACLNGLEMTFIIVLVLTLVCCLLAMLLSKNTISEIKVSLSSFFLTKELPFLI